MRKPDRSCRNNALRLPEYVSTVVVSILQYRQLVGAIPADVALIVSHLQLLMHKSLSEKIDAISLWIGVEEFDEVLAQYTFDAFGASCDDDPSNMERKMQQVKLYETRLGHLLEQTAESDYPELRLLHANIFTWISNLEGAPFVTYRVDNYPSIRVGPEEFRVNPFGTRCRVKKYSVDSSALKYFVNAANFFYQ